MTPLIQQTPAHVTRRANLKRWVSQFDKFAEAAAALDMSPSQLAQIAGPNPSRNIGPVMARRIEKAAAAPEGWLDTPQAPPATDPELDAMLNHTRHLVNEGKLNSQQLAAIRSTLELITTQSDRAPYRVRHEPGAQSEAVKKTTARKS